MKKETVQSPQDHIQVRVVELTKERLFDPARSVLEIAYELDSKYPQHFSRMFKKTTGMTPVEFRNNQWIYVAGLIANRN